MPDKEEESGQKGLVAMGDKEKSDNFSWKDLGEKFFVPDNDSRSTNDEYTPEGCPVIELLLPGVLITVRTDIGKVEEVFHQADDILQVFKIRYHGQLDHAHGKTSYSKFPLSFHGQIVILVDHLDNPEKMVGKEKEHDGSGYFMDCGCPGDTTKQGVEIGSPEGVTEF